MATTRSSSPATDALLAISDEDGDGRLSLDDWLQGGYGTPPAAAGESFRLLDTDGRGYLTRAEISVAARTYLTSAAPEAEATTSTAPPA
ncbi:EF-hand domain-containing protein [Lentzea sp. BCCO 10_0798]|uniref:EF-hand domain-containing protein n=1 Tax=Lentzea kristufekii TaxID=3095430 RepID=A0ABU4U0N7_9PSEU|nr:EF-hand domain-containing protein [Lentzea sp. BCCO 10_0798]MDX8054002.1 EF-hand domain-containing protein [Lentzea sp. BCCO 10_0798]